MPRPSSTALAMARYAASSTFSLLRRRAASERPKPGMEPTGWAAASVLRVLLQPLDAEDLFAQDLIVAPVGAGRQLLDDFTEKWVQESASLMSGRHGALREFARSRAMSS